MWKAEVIQKDDRRKAGPYLDIGVDRLLDHGLLELSLTQLGPDRGLVTPLWRGGMRNREKIGEMRKTQKLDK